MAKVYSREELTDGEGVNKWVRLPSKAGQRLHGISRASLYILKDKGILKTAVVKQPGNLTGIRILWLPSLLSYLESCVEHPAVKK
jgi:hypothetical protein